MGRRFNGIAAAALLAAVGAVSAASVPGAAASTKALQTTRSASGRYATAPATIGNNVGSAGYLGNTSTSAKVKLKVTVPTINCSTSPTGPLFVQVFLNGQLSNSNYTGSGMDIFAYCSGTTPNYSAGLVIDDNNGAGVTVSAGDVLTFDGTAKKKSESYTLTDDNTTQSATGTGAGMTTLNLQLTVQGGQTGSTEFPPFKPMIKYSGIHVNGAVFSTLNPSGNNEVDTSNSLEIQLSALSAAGDAFTLKYVSNT
jgi:hypothetical protein